MMQLWENIFQILVNVREKFLKKIKILAFFNIHKSFWSFQVIISCIKIDSKNCGKFHDAQKEVTGIVVGG